MYSHPPLDTSYIALIPVLDDGQVQKLLRQFSSLQLELLIGLARLFAQL